MVCYTLACLQMADLQSAEKLLEELRAASYDRGVEELQVPLHLPLPPFMRTWTHCAQCVAPASFLQPCMQKRSSEARS